MMDDHYVISEARNQLADALKALLLPDIMTAADFRKAKKHTVAALAALDELLKPDNNALKGTGWMTPFLWLWLKLDWR